MALNACPFCKVRKGVIPVEVILNYIIRVELICIPCVGSVKVLSCMYVGKSKLDEVELEDESTEENYYSQ